ncbi:MAG TPA: hypothetical protein VF230_03930 [Acidimicrobiales bacterium]
MLKVHATEQERVIAVAERIDAAIAAGWRTPRWLAVGENAGGAVWVLQEYVDGARPAAIDRAVAEEMVELLTVQRGLGDGSGGWGEWAAGVVFEDWTGYRQRVPTSFPRGDELVGLVDTIAAACEGWRSPEADYVHGNFNLSNTIHDGRSLWLVDAHKVGPGPVEYDVAELVLLGLAEGVATRDGIDALWGWALGSLDHRALAVCAGSLAMSTADAYEKLRPPADAVAAAPGIVEALTRFGALVAG